MSKAVLITIIVVLVVAVVLIFSLMFGSSSNKLTNQGAGSGRSQGESFMVEGVRVEILEEGSGRLANVGDLVTIDYINKLPDGQKLYSTYDQGRVFNFALGEKKVLRGWDLGLVGMKVGEKRKLTIPPELAYGPKGLSAAGVPENATIISEIRLLRVVTPKTNTAK